jgi:hypothetical protein
VPGGTRSCNLLLHRLAAIVLPRAAHYHFLRKDADIYLAFARLEIPRIAL